MNKENKQTNASIGVALLGIFIAGSLAIYGMYWYFSQPYTRKRPHTYSEKTVPAKVSSQKITTKQYQPRKEWFEEGTLQQATVRQWRSATPTNRLATCGGFLLFAYGENMLKYDMTNPALLRHYARELMNFINASINGVKGIEDKKIYEFVAIGLISLKLQ